MNEGANENNLNTLNGIENSEEQTLDNNIENAFSDLISEFFKDEGTQNLENLATGPVLDWDAVNNGILNTNNNGNKTNTDLEKNAGTIQNTTIYNNLGTINGVLEDNQEVQNAGTYENTNSNKTLYNNLETIYKNGIVGQENEYNHTNDGKDNGTNEIYKNFTVDYNENNQTEEQPDFNENSNAQTIVKNAYGVVTVNGDLLSGIENTGAVGGTIAENKQGNQGTDFRLTQGNLPAKIGFWTKVRNFFIADSKLQYSVQESTQNNGGVWNKLHNLFSFGKNK